MKNEEKIGLTKLEIGLSIAGILVLLCFIVLPPVFRVVFKETKETEYIPKEIEIKTLTCTKNSFYEGEIRKDSQYVIKYYNDNIRTYTITNTSVYNDPAPYDEAKQSEGKAATAYGMVEGINYTVTPDDKDLKITVVEDCDLSTFKSMSVTLPGDTVERKINSAYSRKDSVEEIKRDLETDGYNCK